MTETIGVFEYASGGGFHGLSAERLSPSILVEGSTMLIALLEDLYELPNVVPLAAIDGRLENLFSHFPGAIPIHPNWDFLESWYEIASHCNRTIIIAPECDGILRRCVEEFRRRKISVVASDLPFLEAASNKLSTFQYWTKGGVPTPFTLLACDLQGENTLQSMQNSAPFPCRGWTVKRIDGAGCEGQIHSENPRMILDAIQSFERAQDWIVQPWVVGTAMSVPVLAGQRSIFLNPAKQKIVVEGGKVLYDGGQVEPVSAVPQFDEVVAQWLATLPGNPLGWIGIDFVVTNEGNGCPIPIEVNPRLTTSYTGHRRRIHENLAQGILEVAAGKSWSPSYNDSTIGFQPDGKVELVNGPFPRKDR